MQDDHLPEPDPGHDHLPVPQDRGGIAPKHDPAIALGLLQREDRHDEDEIDLLAYWRMLVKRRWLIMGTIATALAIALVVTLLVEPTFRSTATLEIDPVGMNVMPVQGISPNADSGWDPDFAQTQIELLQSRGLAQRVAEDLRLPGSDILARIEPPSWLQRLRGLVVPGSRTSTMVPAAAADSAAADPPAPRSNGRDASATHKSTMTLAGATSLIRGGLTIEPIRNTHLVQIHYDSTQPAFSAQVANAVAAGFIASSMDRQVGASSYASKYLQDQLDQLRSRLEASEAALVAYAKQANLVPSSSGASLTTQNLTDLNSQLATAQAQRIAAEASWNTVRATHGTDLPQTMLQGSIIPTLQTNLAQLQIQYQQNLKTFKPGFPTMLALKSQIDSLQQQIAGAAASIRTSVKAQYDAAVAQEDMLNQKLAELRSSALNVDSRSIRYNVLKRNVDTNRELYNALLQRYNQVSMATGLRPSNISIIDQAQVPTSRYSPSLTRNLSLGLLLGAFLGIGSALGLEYLDDTLKTPDDIEERLRIGVIATVPNLRKETPADAMRDPRSAYSESYRSARAALQFSTSEGVPRSLFVTSTAPGEGKTTTALTLAHNFARLGKRVLLIECDLRSPSLAKLLDLHSEVGLSSILSGVAPLEDAVVPTDDERLDLILSGPLPPSPTELLASAKLTTLLVDAINNYDQVILDGPPVLGLADAPILANAARGTLLVVSSGATRIKPAQAALKRLRSAHAHVVGGLLTKYDARVAGYDYDGYYSYDGYGSYGASAEIDHDR